MTVWTTTPLVSPKSISKPSIRKHSSSEKLFLDQDQPHYFTQQQQQYLDIVKLPALISFSPPLLPAPPDSSSSNKTSKKATARFVSTCACFLFFFFVTALAFLHCMNLADIPLDRSTPTIALVPDLQQQQKLANQRNPSFPSAESPFDGVPKIGALRGLGTLLRRGTKAMNELVVAHITEDAELRDLRLFLRTLHRSGVPARADVVFLFASGNMQPSKAMFDAIVEENDYFQKLLRLLSNSSSTTYFSEVSDISSSSSSPLLLPSSPEISNATISAFNLNAFLKKDSSANESSSASSSQPLWGSPSGAASQVARANESNAEEGRGEEGSAWDWGSIVAFEVSELNPDDALEGFIDGAPVSLRRWACYQMLLGMVRHRFKNVLLANVYGAAVLGDALAMARRKAGLYVTMEDRTWGVAGDSGGGEPPKVHRRGEAGEDGGKQEDGGRRVELEVAEGGRKGGRGGAAMRGRIPKQGRRVGAGGSSGGLRRRKGSRRSPATPAPSGLCERVYGKSMWSGLEEAEKAKKLVDSGAIAGGIQQIRGLANAMVTEIVKVSLDRNSRDPFPDSVLLSYLLHRSSPVLGKRVLDHIHLLDNSESFGHAMTSSVQPFDFVRRTSRLPYAMVHGRVRSRRWNQAALAIRRDICTSPAEAMVYRDCASGGLWNNNNGQADGLSSWR